jgi:hypothetical protein
MSTYKENLLRQIETASKENEKSLEIFFDTKAIVETRLEAFKATGIFNDGSDIEKGLAIYKDNNADARIRAAAITGLLHYAGENAGLLTEFSELLQAEDTPPAIRNACLYVLQVSRISSPLFAAVKPSYTNALRSLVDSKQEGLQAAAMEYLALGKDEYVQTRLVESLTNPDKKIAEPEVAIQLLSYDLHADHFPILREIVENPPNEASKKEALRSLAADAGSADLLFKTLNNATEDAETRHVCAVALQNMNPASKELAGSYKKILTDSAEDKGLKTALLNTLTFSAQGNILDDDADFQQQLDQVPNNHIEEIKLLTGTDEVSHSAKKKISEFDQMLQQYKSSVEKRKSAQ